jgi:hypothetical protein
LIGDIENDVPKINAVTSRKSGWVYADNDDTSARVGLLAGGTDWSELQPEPRVLS